MVGDDETSGRCGAEANHVSSALWRNDPVRVSNDVEKFLKTGRRFHSCIER